MSKEIISKLSNSSDQKIRDQGLSELESALKKGKLKFTDSELRSIFEWLFTYLLLHKNADTQEEVWTKIANLFSNIKSEEHKQMWNSYFYKCMSSFWTQVKGLNISKFNNLIRNQLAASFKFLNSIWNSNEKFVQNYLNTIYEEVLKGKDVPTDIGGCLAEVYIEEINKNFDKLEISHEKVVQLLNPFLKTLWQTQKVVLFQKIKDSVFNKLIDSNGIDADEMGDLYLPKFDIVEYAENEMHSIFSSDETLDSRREDVHLLYKKASGCDRPIEPFMSLEDRLQQMRMKAYYPKTKHQKKVDKRRRLSKANKMKKRILKMIANQQYRIFPQLNQDNEDEDQLNSYNNDEYGVGMEEITKRILERMNEFKLNKADDLQQSGDGTGGTGDKDIIEKKKSKKKLKETKKSAESNTTLNDSRK